MITVLKHQFSIALILLFLSLIQACTDQDQPIEPELSNIEVVLLAENDHLQNLVSNLNQEYSTNGRTTSILDEVNFERAIKKRNAERGNTHYSFSMSSDDGLTIRKFIISESNEHTISRHIFEYEVDAGWLSDIEEFPGWDRYNGFFRILDLEGTVIAENKIIAGSSINTDKKSGRGSGASCITYTQLIGYICVGGSCSPKYETITTCFSSGDGSGGNETSEGNPEGVGVEMGPTDIPIDGNGGGNSSSWSDGLVILDDPGDKIVNIANYLKCFDLSKSASLTIYVDQPVSNSSDTWTWDGDRPDVGHTFLTITQGEYTRSFGFYPDGGVTPKFSPSNSSVLKDDSDHSYDVSIQLSISSTQLTSIYSDITSANSTYNLNAYNCADFAFDISSSGGLTLPDTYGSWPGGGGSNPGNLGEDIRSMPSSSDYNVDESAGSAPSNSGDCK
jgi:hypothetical protein